MPGDGRAEYPVRMLPDAALEGALPLDDDDDEADDDAAAVAAAAAAAIAAITDGGNPI